MVGLSERVWVMDVWYSTVKMNGRLITRKYPNSPVVALLHASLVVASSDIRMHMHSPGSWP